jgi:transcription initiation factor IIE alpha subunit
MSRLGSNDTKPNKNYFSNTEEVYDLIKMILKELYSKEISDLGMDLLYNGASTLFEIQSRLRLSFENIRNYLIIMLQNNLIQKKSLSRNSGKFISYELKFDQILNILLFPRTLNFIEKKYGDYGRRIFEQFINFGVLTLLQVVEQIQNDQKNGNNFDLVKAQVVELFIKLYEDNLIIYSERANEEENTYKPFNNKNLLGNKDELKKKKKRAKKEKEK